MSAIDRKILLSQFSELLVLCKFITLDNLFFNFMLQINSKK